MSGRVLRVREFCLKQPEGDEVTPYSSEEGLDEKEVKRDTTDTEDEDDDDYELPPWILSTRQQPNTDVQAMALTSHKPSYCTSRTGISPFMRSNEGIANRFEQHDSQLNIRKHPYDTLVTPQVIRPERQENAIPWKRSRKAFMPFERNMDRVHHSFEGRGV
ncbi:hypothetical protein KIN20_035039 [Parelaphostrongylus tenuis]|uniref:Uncharacterized protein n=1 Tax=Parelaphostrongylus tenuis TaxID=148309 RepID=A0AAD5RB92_PARTN|nr:hypothetical protein KIN20_035039 [Parelaphostrongylus tenuis]